jgi:hypothetical protein
MKRRRNLLMRLAILGVFLLASFASPALAQRSSSKDEKLPPYDVQGLEHQRIWVPWVFGFIFAAGCLAIAFKNPHRMVTERA